MAKLRNGPGKNLTNSNQGTQLWRKKNTIAKQCELQVKRNGFIGELIGITQLSNRNFCDYRIVRHIAKEILFGHHCCADFWRRGNFTARRLGGADARPQKTHWSKGSTYLLQGKFFKTQSKPRAVTCLIDFDGKETKSRKRKKNSSNKFRLLALSFPTISVSCGLHEFHNFWSADRNKR